MNQCLLLREESQSSVRLPRRYDIGSRPRVRARISPDDVICWSPCGERRCPCCCPYGRRCLLLFSGPKLAAAIVGLYIARLAETEDFAVLISSGLRFAKLVIDVMVLCFSILAVMHTLLVDVGIKRCVDVMLDLLFSVFFAWIIVPSETLGMAVCTLWRPWHMLLLLLFGLAAGVPPRLHPWASGLPWKQRREAIVGAVLWLSGAFTVLALRRIVGNAEEYQMSALRRRLSIFCNVTGLVSLACAGTVFVMTADALDGFWSFILRPWRAGLSWLLEGASPHLCWEEWPVPILMLWWLSKIAVAMFGVAWEQRGARENIEEVLRFALEHPFSAPLRSFALGGGPRSAIDGPLLGSDGSDNDDYEEALSQKRLIGLNEKHRALMHTRDSLLQEGGFSSPLPELLRLQVRRTNLLEDSWKCLLELRVAELLAPRMNVSFEGESGLDGGGLTRDWFHSVARALGEGANSSSSDSPLAMAADRTLITRPIGPRPAEVCDSVGISAQDRQRYHSLIAVGRFLALAVFHKQSLPLAFSVVLCKHLLGAPVGLVDVQRLDPEFYHGRVEQVLKEGGLAELAIALGEPLTFVSAPTNLCPVPGELRPGGAEMIVTEDNKLEYVQLLCEAYLCGGIRREIQCLLQGFWDLLPPVVLNRSGLSPRELSVLISGVQMIDPEEWRRHSQESGNVRVLAWFWEIVQEDLGEEQRCLLLHFATGSGRLPPGGFAELDPSFTVSVSPGRFPDRLPHAHTCVNQITLHQYESKQLLLDKLLQALTAQGFGFA